MSGCDKAGNVWVDVMKQEMDEKDFRLELMAEGRLYKT
jgi:hypothetical protein